MSAYAQIAAAMWSDITSTYAHTVRKQQRAAQQANTTTAAAAAAASTVSNNSNGSTTSYFSYGGSTKYSGGLVRRDSTQELQSDALGTDWAWSFSSAPAATTAQLDSSATVSRADTTSSGAGTSSSRRQYSSARSTAAKQQIAVRPMLDTRMRQQGKSNSSSNSNTAAFFRFNIGTSRSGNAAGVAPTVSASTIRTGAGAYRQSNKRKTATAGGVKEYFSFGMPVEKHAEHTAASITTAGSHSASTENSVVTAIGVGGSVTAADDLTTRNNSAAAAAAAAAATDDVTLSAAVPSATAKSDSSLTEREAALALLGIHHAHYNTSEQLEDSDSYEMDDSAPAF
jgi:hypothetical protein